MALTAVNRQRVLNQWMRDNTTELPAVTKADLAAVIAAADDWMDANVTAFNAALPQPGRAALSTAMKFDLFAYVLMRRQGRLRTQEDG